MTSFEGGNIKNPDVTFYNMQRKQLKNPQNFQVMCDHDPVSTKRKRKTANEEGECDVSA